MKHLGTARRASLHLFPWAALTILGSSLGTAVAHSGWVAAIVVLLAVVVACRRLRPVGRPLTGLLALAGVAALSERTEAHDVSPLSFEMLPGSAANLSVADVGSCSATITVTSTNPSVVTVDGGGSSTKVAVAASFTIQAAAGVVTPQTVSLQVCWIGEDFPDGPCNENNCSSPLIVTVNVIDEPLDTGNEGALNAASVTDPINTFTGELYEVAVPDLSLGGPMPLLFQRYYASNLRKDFILGDLGSNWLHNFDARLLVTGNTAIAISASGRVTKFLSGGVPAIWTQLTNLDTPYQLSTGGGQDAVLFDPVANRVHTFDFTTGGPLTGKLVKVEDGQGRAHTLTYDPVSGQLQSVSDGLGRTLTFTYNADFLPKIQTVSDGTRTIVFEYTDPIDSEVLTRVTDARGWMTINAYEDTSAVADHALLLTKQRPELNIPFRQTWYDVATPDSSGRVQTQTDAAGNTTTLAYDPLGTGQTTITDALANTTVHTHSGSGEITRLQDEQGLNVFVANDISGRRIGLTDRLGDGTTYTYHLESGKLASVTNAEGGTTIFTYTARAFGGVTLYDLTGISHPNGTVESFTYDGLGRMTSHTDPLGNVASATYDANGNPLTETNRAGGTVTDVYDALGRLASTTNPAGNTTSFAYDAFGRPSTITHPDGATRSFTFDPMDHPLSTTDENGHTSTATFDKNGNLRSAQNGLGETLTIGYDGNDRPISTLDPLGSTTSTTFDELGRVANETDANLNTTSYGYDSRGRLTSITSPGGRVRARTYDDEGILTASTTPLGNATTYTSDRMGRRTAITTPSGSLHRMTYDVMGQLASRIDPLGNTTTFFRDARGLVTRVTAPGGVTTAYGRDALGNVTSLADPIASVWTSTFDTDGRRTADADPLGNTTAFAYDDRDRTSVVTYPGTMGTLTLGYDPVGNRTSATWSDGTTHSFAYDAADQMTAATGMSLAYDAAGRLTSSNGIAIGVDPGGRTTTMTYAPGKTVTYTYDADDRVTEVTDWVGGTTLLTYDADDRLTGMTRPNGIHGTFTYDPDGRVLGLAEGTVSDITLVRDARGNVTSATRNVPTAPSAAALVDEAHTYDAASRLTGASYDELGRLTGSGTDTYTWNLASHLTSYTRGGTTVTSTYDAAGLRLSRAEGGTTRSYVWNLDLPVPSISVEREGGVDLFYYVHLPDGRLLHRVAASGGARGFYHFDETGNTLFVTDDGGAVMGSYAYSPFGRLLDSTGALDNPFTWGGRHGVMSEGNDLYYVRARYYDGTLGRFLSRDPVRSIGPLGVNPYQYAYANPQRFVDRTGLSPEENAGVERLSTFQEFFARLLGAPEDPLGIQDVEPTALDPLDPVVLGSGLLSLPGRAIDGSRIDDSDIDDLTPVIVDVPLDYPLRVETSTREAVVFKGMLPCTPLRGDPLSPSGARKEDRTMPVSGRGSPQPAAFAASLRYLRLSMPERLAEAFLRVVSMRSWSPGWRFIFTLLILRPAPVHEESSVPFRT